MHKDTRPGIPPGNILDNLRTAVVCLDASLTVSYLNTASEMLFGVSARHCHHEVFDRALPYLADHRPRLTAARPRGAVGGPLTAHVARHARRQQKKRHEGSRSPRTAAR